MNTHSHHRRVYEHHEGDDQTRLEEQRTNSNHSLDQSENSSSRVPPMSERYWKPRKCRICFETVYPTFRNTDEHIPGIFQRRPNVIYTSEEGRLLRPCKCKGSSKYVHEGCLQRWRMQNPNNERNYWKCPTCGYKYRLSRLGWSTFLVSTGRL
jgi:hypothetical protein